MRRLLIALLVLAAARPAPAQQCPDGTPPPCRAAGPARPAAARSLDARTWVVLPFTNVTREPELAWLSDAAVNLLYLDLSRWTDIRVVDDGRVSDVVRALPPADREVIGLNTGLGLARRLGAGRLVMGDLVKSGPQTTVVAKVYDVARGQRLRTVRDEFTSRETTMPAFARLAGKVLDAAPTTATTQDAVGTTSLDAYQEYAAGLRELAAWELDSARGHFERAIRHDSTFALAHYRLSIALGWILGFSRELVPPAEAATRFAGGLPARERGLIRGQDQFVHNRYADACETFRGLIAADSTDVEAWYQLGECSFHDGGWVPTTPDSSQWRPRGDKTASFRAFLRTLTLAAEMHLAYEHLIDMLRQGLGGMCLGNRCESVLDSRLELRGDSIVASAVRRSRQQPPAPLDSAIRRANLAAAAAIAQRWLAAAPNESEAHYQYSLVLAAQQRFSEAASEIAAARQLGVRPQPTGPPALQQIAALFMADSLNQRTLPRAVLLADSVVHGQIPLPAWTRDASARQYQEATALAVVAGTIGAFSRVPMRIPQPSYVRPGQGTIPDGYYRAVAALASGVAPTGLDGLLAGLADTSVYIGLRRSAPMVLGHLCPGVCRLPAALAADSMWHASPVARAQAGDTSGARVGLRRLDSMLTANEAWGPPDAEFLLQSALVRLALRDSAAALEKLLRADRVRGSSYGGFSYGYALGSNGWLVGRVWLMTADLLAASGRNEEAQLYYRRVADLWARADPELQPFVQRARAALPDYMR